MASNDCLTCFNMYDNGEHRVRMLPCGHSQCTRCIQAQFANGLITCASCRITHTYTDVNAIPVNYTAEKMKEEIDKLKKQMTLLEENYATPLTPKMHEGICVEHAAYKLFWCNAHYKWICTHCSVTDHPRGDCDIIPIKTKLKNNKDLIKSKISKELMQLDTIENELKLSIDDVEKQTKEETKQITQFKDLIEELKKLVFEKQKDIAVLNARHPKLITLGQECKDKKTELDNLITGIIAATTFKELDKENEKCDSAMKSCENWRKKLEEDNEISLNTLPAMLEKLMMVSDTQEKMKMIEETKKMLQQGIQKRQMYGIKKIGNTDYYALIEYSQGLIFINDLQKNISPGANATVVKFENVMALVQSPPVAFITLTHHGTTIGELHIQLDGLPRRVQQFIDLVTGSSGHGSYRAASFDYGVNKHKAATWIYCQHYNTTTGGTESEALYQVEQNIVDTTLTEGLVYTWENQQAGFGMFFNVKSNELSTMPILGRVTSGLPGLKEILEKLDVKSIVFSKCGLIINTSM